MRTTRPWVQPALVYFRRRILASPFSRTSEFSASSGWRRLFSSSTTEQTTDKPVTDSASDSKQSVAQRVILQQKAQAAAGTPQSSSTPTAPRSDADVSDKAKSSYVYPTEKKTALLNAFDHCCDEVEKEEPQVYMALNHLKCEKDAQRLAVCVLRALNLELSRVRADANSAEAAKMRLDWWQANVRHLLTRDDGSKTTSEGKSQRKIDERTGKVQLQSGTPAFDTPTLRALAVVVRKYNLNPSWLLRLVTGRESFLTSNTFMSELELEEYAENTQTLLLYLSMEVLGQAYSSGTSNHFKAASHIGAFMTFVACIRSVPIAVASDFISLPDDVSLDYRLWEDEATILKGKSTAALREAIEHMSLKAYAHLLSARELKDTVSGPVQSLLLCATGYERYLFQLEKRKFDVFHDSLFKPDIGLGFKSALLMRSTRGSF